MKVIQILPELNAGGVERGTLEIGRALIERGHESIVISNGGHLTKQLESEGSRHIALPVHKKALSSLTQIKALRRVFEQEKPDIIHLRSRLPAWLAYLAWRGMNKSTRPRLVTTVHGFYSVNAYSAIMTKGERVICVSNSVKDYVLQNYPKVPEGKLTVIHRGVDPEEFPHGYQPPEDWLAKWHSSYPQIAGKFIVTLPGRITRWKGHLDFVKIIDGLKATGIPVHGLVAGDPHPKKLDFYEELKTAIREAHLDKDITLAGHRSDLREVMAISDVIVSCSTTPEAFGRVTLEALYLGKPVAAYAHGGVAEQLDTMNSAGKIPPSDPRKMQDLLKEWVKTPPTPNINSRFTLNAMQTATLDVYHNLLSNPSELD